MEVIQSPQIKILQTGQSLKVLNVKGTEGMHMPFHHSTSEAIVVDQKGSAILWMEGKEYKISVGSSTLIPAGVNHSLTINQGFEAVVLWIINQQSYLKTISNYGKCNRKNN